tara:strand:+ start:411 stop:1058 length:648 start_codon:yes stop_codon:yes gene_type:complete
MGSISRLDAVNQMLLAAGESLVSDLENNSGVDTGLAEFVLDRVSQDHQIRGVVNNRYVRKYNLSTAGDINLPSELLSAELVSNHVDDDGNTIIGIDRQQKLYNTVENTYTWDKDTDYYVEIVVELAWDDISTPMQRAILATSMRHYQLVVQGDEVSDAFLTESEQVFRAMSRADNVNNSRNTIFNSSSDVMRAALSRNNDLYNDPRRFRYWRFRG